MWALVAHNVRQLLAHAGSCELELQLVSEQVASPFWAALPPTNALRNMALQLANTEVICLSLPFWPAQSPLGCVHLLADVLDSGVLSILLLKHHYSLQGAFCLPIGSAFLSGCTPGPPFASPCAEELTRIENSCHSGMQVVLLADVDVLPTLDLSRELLRLKICRQLAEKLQGGYALVLPLLDVAGASEEEAVDVAKRLVTGISVALFSAVQACHREL